MKLSTRLAVSLCAICLWAGSAGADPVVPQIVPQCEVFGLEDGRRVCGWIVLEADGTETLEQWREVLRADAELAMRRDQDAARDAKVVELEGQVEDLRAAAAAAARALEVLRTRNAELTAIAIKTDRSLQECQVRPRWGTTLSWGTAATAAALLLGYVAVDQL